MTAYVPRNHLKTNTIEGAPSIVRLPKKIKPEDISMDDLRHLSSDSFALWTQTAGVEVDGNAVDFDMHRYLLPIYMCNDTEIVWQKAAQMGATIYMLLKVIHWLNAHPGRKAGLYFPTKEGVENLSKDRLTPLLGSIKDLETSIDKEDKLGLRKIGKSSFYLFHLGGTASKDSVPLDFVAFDEVRLCRPADIDQAMERISHSIYKQKILMSTCHRGDTRIIVRKKVDIKHWQVSTPPVSMSFEELKSCWQDYQALCYYSSDGANYTYRNITAFHDNGVKEVVKATFDDGTEVVSTPNHEFAWCDSTGNICWDSLAMLHKNGTHILSNTKASRIVNLEPVEATEVYDITVDQYHNYVLENGAVAHNCGMPSSDIAARFDLGSQHVWMARCGCPDGCDLARTFPACVVDDKRRNKLYLRCPKCKYTINDPQNGRYVPHNPGADYTSFHVSQLTSKYMPLKVLWDFYHRTTNKAEFFNAKLGLPYIDEENRGVGLSQLRACVDTSLQWASPGQTNTTAMGVDVGGGYCYVFIADLHGDKKRIRHVEIIESENPNYMENGKRVTPFKRLRELMREYKVQMCVVDAMPNYDMVIEFAQEFPGKVFASFYAKEAKDVVSWSDRPKVKAGIKKAGPLLKFKYYCVLSRFLSLDVALSQWANQEVICPDPDQLVQMCFKENSKDLNPEAPMTRAFSMFMRLIKRYNITNEETGEGRHEWIYSGGDPHFAHAWNYCNVALERLRRTHSFTFL